MNKNITGVYSIKQPFLSLIVLLLSCAIAFAQTPTAATAQYLANEGVMVVDGETKVVFDPLF